MNKKAKFEETDNHSHFGVSFSSLKSKPLSMSMMRSCFTFLIIMVLIALVNVPVFGFDVTPTQPGASNNYALTDVYTLPGGAQMSVVLNPAGVEQLILGGTSTFLATLQAEFPGWTFTSASSDLSGTFDIVNSYACGLGTTDCATEQGVPSTIVGCFIDVTYTAGTGDPTASANDLHWIQRIYSNHALGTGGGHGTNVDKIDNDNNTVDPVMGTCSESPYYDCGYFAGETYYVDRPSRSSDSDEEHVWGAELYLVEQTADKTVTIYNGIKWGWLNTASDVRTVVAPPSGITFDNPVPSVGGATVATGIGTNNITWGSAISTSFPSSLSITPSTFDLTPMIGEPFVMGTITYSNGTISGGSGINSIDMTVSTVIDVADLDIAGLNVDDTRIVTMINTPNTCNADVAGDCTIEEKRESADYVTIPPASDLTVIPSTFPNFNELGNNFHVFEESSATATLIGRITEEKINTASGGGGGLLPPGPNAPPPGTSAPRRYVVELLGFGKLLEGDGFITRGLPGGTIGDIIDPVDVGGILSGGGTVSTGFGVDNQVLTQSSITTLEKVAHLMLRTTDININLSGYTSDKGSKESNKSLSLKLAKQVQQFLVMHGISKDRIIVHGYSEDASVDSLKTKRDRLKTRRVEIKLVKKIKKKN